MKKAEQNKINETVLEFLDNVNRELPAWWKEVKPCTRLDSCTAWVYDLCGYKLLVSYNTFVAAASRRNCRSPAVLNCASAYGSQSS